MTDNKPFTDNPEELDRIYNATVDHHRAYLNKLHQAFNKRCEKIRQDAHQKIDQTDENDKEVRKKILEEEKRQLDQTLAELKYAVSKSSREAREKLEEIENKRDQSAVDLEKELATL